MTADTGRPNVVIIYADDLGWGDLGCFGAEDFDTPALDGLAAGVRLSQWYSNSPVCSPSRASLLTGRHPAHAGVESILGGSSDNGPSVEERNWLNGEEVSYNGGSAGGLRGHKGSLLEGGIRVPTMISWPARLPAGRSSDLVGFMADVVPTVLEAVDGAAPADETLDGSSVLPLLAAGEAGDDRWLFWKHDDQLAARHGRWKIVLDACDSLEPEVVVPEGLYDLHEDPGERHNLAAARPERFGRMRAELTGWAARRPS